MKITELVGSGKTLTGVCSVMKIYTRTGDFGKTGLIGAQRLSKGSIRIEAYGTVDELNALIGVIRAYRPVISIDPILDQIQNSLMLVGASLASPTSDGPHFDGLKEHQITELEEAIDSHQAALPELVNFVLPGGSVPGSQLHFARTICRRAERRVVELIDHEEAVSELVVRYLNRLSDLLFVLARFVNAGSGVGDVKWDNRS
ncbi:MAG: cob(I)yrinic acid a,c-diamide adenosyltransferase [Planctomycetota bacterium]|nr:cob(I)yrinic acid a,c-diamide adenosyltransferase [Planctomycetota bacterium]